MGENGHESEPIVKPEEQLGEAALDHIEEPMGEVSEDAKGKLLDVDTAWDVAHTSKSKRDAEASWRRHANALPVVVESLPEVAPKLSETQRAIDAVVGPHYDSDEYTDGSFDDLDTQSRRRYEEHLAPARRLDPSIVPEYQQREHAVAEEIAPLIAQRNEITHAGGKDLEWLFDQFGRELALKGGDYKELDSFKQLKDGLERATEYSHRMERERAAYAERLEGWAEVLHDNPPSEAFKQRFGLQHISAAMLIETEQEIQVETERMNDETYVRKLNRALTAIDGSDVGYWNLPYATEHSAVEQIQKMVGRELSDAEYANLRVDRIHRAVYAPDSEEVQRYEDLLSERENPERSEELAELYKEAVRQFVSNFSLGTRLKETFLEDIKSGRAAQWQ